AAPAPTPTPTPAWPPTSSPSSDSTTPTPPAGSPDGPAARARQRLGRLNGDFGDVGDVAAVLDRRGDQFAQARRSHDGGLARGGGTAGGRKLRGVAGVLEGRDEGLEPLALQVAGVGAERGEIADPAQREGQIGLATAIQAWIACPTWASHGARGST